MYLRLYLQTTGLHNKDDDLGKQEPEGFSSDLLHHDSTAIENSTISLSSLPYETASHTRENLVRHLLNGMRKGRAEACTSVPGAQDLPNNKHVL